MPEEGTEIVTDVGVIRDVEDFKLADRLLRERPLKRR